MIPGYFTESLLPKKRFCQIPVPPKINFTGSNVPKDNWNPNCENNHSQFLAILRFPLEWVH